MTPRPLLQFLVTIIDTASRCLFRRTNRICLFRSAPTTPRGSNSRNNENLRQKQTGGMSQVSHGYGLRGGCPAAGIAAVAIGSDDRLGLDVSKIVTHRSSLSMLVVVTTLRSHGIKPKNQMRLLRNDSNGRPFWNLKQCCIDGLSVVCF
jgi:hypothetical protein